MDTNNLLHSNNNFNILSQLILTEISNNILQSDIEYKFQNHLFGCLSILEYIDEGNGMIDNYKLHIKFNSDNSDNSDNSSISYNLLTIDISNEFCLIGVKLGFWNDDDLILDLNSPMLETYKNMWINLFKFFENTDETCGFIEDFEELCYELYRDRLGTDCPFVKCIEGNEIVIRPERPECPQRPERPVEHNPEVNQKSRKFNHTARRRRNLTPVFRRKGFNKTRKTEV